jgi:ferredoxin-thioredoxin reductase catalytic subunit
MCGCRPSCDWPVEDPAGMCPFLQVEDALKREDQQFSRLHFALQKAQSDSARMGALQQMLDRRGPPP